MAVIEPLGVGVDKEEEDHTEGHEIHVDEEEYTAVVEAPAALHAADVIDGASGGDEDDGKDEEVGPVVWEVGEEERDAEAGEDKEAAAKEGSLARVKKMEGHSRDVSAYG